VLGPERHVGDIITDRCVAVVVARVCYQYSLVLSHGHTAHTRHVPPRSTRPVPQLHLHSSTQEVGLLQGNHAMFFASTILLVGLLFTLVTHFAVIKL